MARATSRLTACSRACLPQGEHRLRRRRLLEEVLHDFATPPKGMDPWPEVIRDSAGNFYGTAEGGRYGFGVVYKLDTAGNETVLYNFTGEADGGDP